MKKIVYAITKIGKKENTKLTGCGYITDEDIIIACVSKKGKSYVRIFENAVKVCYKSLSDPTEFKGAYSEMQDIEVEDKHGAKSTIEVEVDYMIWYKLI
jgi:hypothetical protein